MASKRTTVRDLRRHNRSLLLSKLYFDGPLSRAVANLAYTRRPAAVIVFEMLQSQRDLHRWPLP